MEVFKKTIAVLVGILFLFAFAIFMFSLSLNHTLLSEKYMKNLAQEVDLYERVPTVVFSLMGQGNPDIASSKQMETLIQKGISEDKTQLHLESIMTQIYDQDVEQVKEDLSSINRSMVDAINEENEASLNYEDHKFFPDKVNFSKDFLGHGNRIIDENYLSHIYVYGMLAIVLILFFAMFFISSTKGGKRLMWAGWFLLLSLLGTLSMTAVLYVIDPSWVVNKALTGEMASSSLMSLISDILDKIFTDIRINYMVASAILFVLVFFCFFFSTYCKKDPERCEGSKWWNCIN